MANTTLYESARNGIFREFVIATRYGRRFGFRIPVEAIFQGTMLNFPMPNQLTVLQFGTGSFYPGVNCLGVALNKLPLLGSRLKKE